MDKILTLDVGTTSVKAGLFDSSFKLLGLAIEEYTLYTPQNNCAELNPEIYWENAVKAVNKVIDTTGTNPNEIVSITFTTQGETLISIDESGKSIGNAIVWLDNRAVEEAEIVKKITSVDEFYKHTGLPGIDGFQPLSKLMWIKKNMPEVYDSTYKFVLLEDYLIYRFSGIIVSNPSILSSTGYYDIVENHYWDSIIEKCGLDKSKLPDVIPCGFIVGKVCREAIDKMNLSSHTVVTTGAMDQVAMAVGCGNIKEGIVNDTIGTCQVVGATGDDSVLNKLSDVTVYTHVIPGKYYLLTFNQAAGIVMKWFRDEFCKDIVDRFGIEGSFDEMSRLASETPPLCKGVTFYSDEKGRNNFNGTGIDTDRGCFIRSIMEFVCRKSKENLTVMGIKPEVLISLGGGGKSPVWNQIKANIMNKPIVTIDIEEAALFGAAVIGAKATGIIDEIEEGCKIIKNKAEFYPNEDAELYR